MKTNKFKITLEHKDTHASVDKIVEVMCFAEAASRAYQIKNMHGHSYEIIAIKKLEV